MEIRKLNELLMPYKIEIICETCQRQSDQSSQSVNLKNQKNDIGFACHTEKKPLSKSKKISKLLNTNTAQRIHSSNSKKMDFKANAPKYDNYSRNPKFPPPQKIIFPIHLNPSQNPPNPLLNSKHKWGAEETRTKNLMDLMTLNPNTPNKIEDIEVGKIDYSEKKENNFNKNLTNSTNRPLLPGHEESPVSHLGRRKFVNHDNSFSDKHFALGGYSRESSPINTPYYKNIGTPSCNDRTPQRPIHFTPNMRENDLNDEGQPYQFNLFQYPFGDDI